MTGSAELRSDLDNFWQMQHRSPRLGGTLQVVSTEAVVPALGFHSRGEDYDCRSNQVKCAFTTVNTPAGATITNIVREAREESGGPFTTDPYPVLGWCDWSGGISQTAGGGNQISLTTTLKNWSDNRARRLRLTVYYII